MRRLLCIAVLMLAAAFSAAAQDLSAHEKRKARLEEEIAMIDRQLKDNNSKHRDVTQQLQLIRRKISNRENIIYDIRRRISGYEKEIAGKTAEIERMSAEMDTLLVYYEKLVRAAYRNRDSRLWFAYIFAGEDLSQGLRRYSYLKKMSRMMDSQARQIKQLQQQLSDEKASLEKLRAEAVSARKDRERELSALKQEEKSAQSVETKLRSSRRTYEKQLAAKKKEVEELSRKIRQLVEEAMAAKDAPKVDYKLSGEFSSNKGCIPWPTSSHAVIESFGQHYHPVFKGVKLPYNYGVNIATAPKAQVRAVFDGVVKQVVVMPGYSQCVLVQHGEYFTFYCKLGSVAVKAGQTVTAGELVGTVDTVNGDTVFHFQIWKGQEPQNPELWLSE